MRSELRVLLYVYSPSMRMAELSARSGVPIPTVRFYIREGLLPAGKLTSPNQATYDETHVRTLKLIRTLVHVGGLSIPRARQVLAHVTAEDAELYPTLGKVQYSLTPDDADAPDHDAENRVRALIAEQGWSVRPDNPARRTLAHAVETLMRLGQDDVVAKLGLYAEAAEHLARREVDDLLGHDSVEGIAEGVIAYAVLGDAVLSALRRLAQESVITARLRTR